MRFWRFTRATVWPPGAVVLVYLLLTAGAPAQTNAPRFVSRSFIGDAFALGFVPNTTGWTSVESSADGSTWKLLASVATTNASTIFVDEDAARAAGRFYRLHQPGASVEAAEAKWSLGPTNYTFQLQRVRTSSAAAVLSGTVTVQAGQKLVTNASLNGDPLPQPNPEDFPSVAELYTILRGAQQTGCWRVAAAYDESRGFPTWCVVERLTPEGPALKQVDQYWITGLTPLAPGN